MREYMEREVPESNDIDDAWDVEFDDDYDNYDDYDDYDDNSDLGDGGSAMENDWREGEGEGWGVDERDGGRKDDEFVEFGSPEIGWEDTYGDDFRDIRRDAINKADYVDLVWTHHRPTTEDFLDISDLPYVNQEDPVPEMDGTSSGVDDGPFSKPPSPEASVDGPGLPTSFGSGGLLDIFVDPLVRENFGLKIFFIKLLATFVMFDLYYLTLEMGSDLVKYLSTPSDGVIGSLSSLQSALAGLVLGLSLVVFTGSSSATRKRFSGVVGGVIFTMIIIIPVLAMLLLDGEGVFVDTFFSMALFLGKIMLIILTLVPMVIGTFVIWSRRGPWFYSILTVMMLLGVIIASNIMDVMGITSSATFAPDLFDYFLYALVLFMFLETRDSSLRHFRVAREISYQESSPRIKFYDAVLNGYFVYLVVLLILSLCLSLLMFQRQELFGAMGSTRLAESLEVTSFFGLVISVVIMVSLLGVAVTLFRNRSGLSRLLRGVQTNVSGRREKRYEIKQARKEMRELKKLYRKL